MRTVLHDVRFVDKAPAEVYATLLDEGRYVCSERTVYRVLEADHELRERRDILHHKNHAKPELLATKSNELWSWDITKLHGPGPTEVDILLSICRSRVFSRYLVGWMVAHAESAVLATKLIEQTCERQGILRETLRACSAGTWPGTACSGKGPGMLRSAYPSDLTDSRAQEGRRR